MAVSVPSSSPPRAMRSFSPAPRGVRRRHTSTLQEGCSRPLMEPLSSGSRAAGDKVVLLLAPPSGLTVRTAAPDAREVAEIYLGRL